MKVYILKWKEIVLCGRKLNVEYALFVRQTDESMWLRKVETWLLYFVLLTVFLQSSALEDPVSVLHSIEISACIRTCY